MKCRICGSEAVVKLEYANLKLCEEDFIRFFENRVERTVKRYKMLPRGSKVVVGLSGGKDSSSLLHALWRLRDRLGIEVEALTIDLGIAGYSEACLDAAKELCRRLGVPLKVVSLESEYGFTVDDAAKSLRSNACSACGTIKRYLLNRVAREMKAYAIATGHNLDDTLAAVLQALVRGDVNSLARIGPVLPPTGKFVARVKPLIETPESDSKLYADFLDLGYVAAKCPYSRGATSFAYKAAIELLEHEFPSVKLQMLRPFLDKVQPSLGGIEEGRLTECVECGEPTSRQLCRFCRVRTEVLRKKVSSQPTAFMSDS
ncbi:MAG: TIGR00269 family protein [Thermofilaceae archaeon]